MNKIIVRRESAVSKTAGNSFKVDYENIEVKVGDGCTILYYSDREPATVIEVGKNYVKVQKDKAIRIDSNGMSDSQEYEYERDLNGAIYTFKKCRKSKFTEADKYTDNGKRNRNDYGCSVAFGFRKKYYDYTF